MLLAQRLITCSRWAQLRGAKALTQQICDFLEAEGGGAPSAAVIAHFGDRVPAAKMALFRQLLKQARNRQGGSPILLTMIVSCSFLFSCACLFRQLPKKVHSKVCRPFAAYGQLSALLTCTSLPASLHRGRPGQDVQAMLAMQFSLTYVVTIGRWRRSSEWTAPRPGC